MNIATIIPNPIAAHRKHHQPSKACYQKLEELKKRHYLATLTKSSEKEAFLNKINQVDSSLRQANVGIAAVRKKITHFNLELKKTTLCRFREILRLKIRMENKALKKLKDQKRLLKGDIDTLCRPENRFLFSLEQINVILEANRQKTVSKDKIIPRICAYLGGFLGAIPATIIAVLAFRGISVPIFIVIGSAFLGSGGGTILGLILEKPFRRIRKKLL